jgi:hypothetical protein
MKPRTTRGWAAMFLFVGLAGCGRGPTTYQVSGGVTFRGSVVPRGEVTLEPDPTAGNRGAQIRVPIVDGRYRTLPGKGIAGGAMVIRLTGRDGVPVAEAPDGVFMFEMYSFSKDMPKQDSVLDIDVPASLAIGTKSRP